MPNSERKGEFPHHALTNGLKSLITGTELIEEIPKLTELTDTEKEKLKTVQGHLKAAHTLIDSILQDRTPYPY